MSLQLYKKNLIVDSDSCSITLNQTQPAIRISEIAVDLYNRGLNIFPVPTPSEVKRRAVSQAGESDTNQKPPYFYKPFVYTRLHLCSSECIHNPCLPIGERFEDLFIHANIACMSGRTSGNLICIDCDSEKASNQIEYELEQRLIHYWAYRTNRGRGYLIRLLEGEAKNIYPGQCKIPDVQVWGQEHYVVLPPSIHPFGIVYEWLNIDPFVQLPFGQPPPVISARDLEWLGVELAYKSREKKTPLDNNLPGWSRKLSFKNRDFLLYGTNEGERNHKLTSAAYDMAGNDIDYFEAKKVLLESAERCNPPYPDRDTLVILDCAYRKRREPAIKPSQNPIEELKIAEEFAKYLDWKVYGRMAQTARNTFLALIKRSRMDNSLTFRASEREIAELANFREHARARRGLKALSDYASEKIPALIEFVDYCSYSHARMYKFTNFVMSRDINSTDNINQNSIPNSTIIHNLNNIVGHLELLKNELPSTLAEKDVFGKLGIISWRVWKYLCQKPERRKSAIIRGLNLNINSGSVSKAIKKLMRYGLVSYSSAEGLYLGEIKTEKELEIIAENLGASGVSAKQKRKYQIERERRVNHKLAMKRLEWAKKIRHAQDMDI